VFRVYQACELLVEGGKVGMRGNGMKGRVVAVIALVLPDVDCSGQFLFILRSSSMILR
jgi:hypothetical protein